MRIGYLSVSIIIKEVIVTGRIRVLVIHPPISWSIVHTKGPVH